MGHHEGRSAPLDTKGSTGVLPVYSGHAPSNARLSWSKGSLKFIAALTLLFLFPRQFASTYSRWNRFGSVSTTGFAVDWKSCGDNFECANISLPLDYHNESDPRRVSIAVTKYLATNTSHREGAVFINPGGPGGSGTNMAFTRGPTMSDVLQGRYDIIGFDPRGINLTRPYVSCFESKLDEDVFASAVHTFHLNLPVNVTESVRADLEGQVAEAAAAMEALSKHCAERVGDAMAYMGTEFVVRDIDAMSRIIEGEDKRVNYWGFSYGTILGQYLIKILPPSRLGKIMIDGVVNPEVWVGYSPRSFEGYFNDIDNVLYSFAESCVSSGSACALSAMSPSEIVSKLDETIESLYYNPQPITDLPAPAVATARNIRQLVFSAMYRIKDWPDLAVHLDNAFKGNYSGVVNASMVHIDPEGASKLDYSSYSGNTIRCTDAKPYPSSKDFPSNSDIAEYVVESMKTYSGRMGDMFFPWSFCHLWEGIYPRRSRYEGTFEMEDGTLDTPILVLSNTYDPVTPLSNAILAKERLGDNARLIQQVDGWGHCTIAQKSYCTGEIISRYMLDGEVPKENHTLCNVVEKPFVPAEEAPGDDGEKAWARLVDEWQFE
ncbi:hypothetical protein GLOTRDRAFT_123620 [Gloeophyllum trabeum ATCC 11539]|uniref:Peptidase S33 tripeptidyl aminopeptidase-like C-terminal domain-containing protein n=1 Tax=Gloeophyllum trabeum (strain ATCC 11539 / FP-39264 / Madison 617) TaxID=670483 RepID=S7PS93_GLOTA|nr:uncharacterized protein GLOTRDRAFT_123620 [Gloeophyllum trabeum ATCC 11539]EPQ50268.1 hypothetical protein GLOTRDRAFT_123620 [Gloeophyllum trabeum ATCC 11539]